MTKADKIYKVKCTYDMSSKNITFGMVPIRLVGDSHRIARIYTKNTIFIHECFKNAMLDILPYNVFMDVKRQVT